MGIFSMMRNIKRINRLKAEIKEAEKNKQDTTPLIRKKFFIAQDLYNEVHSTMNGNPTAFMAVSKLAGSKVSEIDDIFLKIQREAEAKGIDTGVKGD